MRHCEACGRDFQRRRGDPMDCPYCGYNTMPRGMPRSRNSLQRMAQGREETTEEDHEPTPAEDD